MPRFSNLDAAINYLPYSNIGYRSFLLNYDYPPTLLVEFLKGDENVKVEAIASFVSRIQS